MTISKTEDDTDLETSITKGASHKNTEHGKKKKKKKKESVDPDSVAPDSVVGQVVQKRSEEGSGAKHDETDLEASITTGASHKNTAVICLATILAVICLGIILFFSLRQNRPTDATQTINEGKSIPTEEEQLAGLEDFWLGECTSDWIEEIPSRQKGSPALSSNGSISHDTIYFVLFNFNFKRILLFFLPISS